MASERIEIGPLTIPAIQHTLSTIGQVPRKHLGQNFIASKPTVQRTIELCNFSQDETILEIGPGLGALTFGITAVVKHVHVIEINPIFSRFLESRAKKASISNLSIITADALEINFPDADKIISSMPYSISGPLTSKILERLGAGASSAYLICQVEFATKLTAHAGTMDYSRLSANVAFIACIEPLMEISRKNFFPEPRVDSMLVALHPNKTMHGISFESYKNITRRLFPFKNKLMRRASAILLKNQGNVPEKKMKDLVNSVPYKDRRVRDLDVEDLVVVTKWFSEQGIDFDYRNGAVYENNENLR